VIRYYQIRGIVHVVEKGASASWILVRCNIGKSYSEEELVAFSHQGSYWRGLRSTSNSFPASEWLSVDGMLEYLSENDINPEFAEVLIREM